MANFLLIHGAWHGSWFWKRVRTILLANGHSTFTPTLTGLADRKHLLSRKTDLETHIADVCNLVVYEELHDVTLVGHSYGGIVARHVADRMPERIRSLVYVDAFVPQSGKSMLDYVPDGGKQFRELAAAYGEGWKVPPIPAAAFRLNDADAAWADNLFTMHPLSTFETPAQLTGACDSIARIGFVLATGYESPFPQFLAFAKERGWWQAELPCGHEVALDMPRELSALLQRAADEYHR